ncbi:PA domain protein (macronuclear) [Tetrahymena thermophila SB210]|uniref:PA domain protein n=1 Tax=Tetrahymena thermophila (strain SB210) TaxID=312017 RepID=I7MDD0_TETTS|nr:PA domain protein [Tetrahymena thermophila SB210]EAR87352.1 PA domain protein [Tetrahymena thermophila SB210]|eukprot:XP_001007597.1 PA domain protein [Tetrahymena thermophila SB210]
MQKVILLILLSLVVIQAEDTYLNVYSKNQKYSFKVSLANFGQFRYGHTLTGRIQIGANYTYWGDQVDMNRINKTSNEYVKVNNTNLFDKPNGVKLDTSGCKSYQQFNDAYIQSYGSPIYIVDRGYCTFVRKASLAAKTGKMLIIIDNSDNEDVTESIMGDDLSGEKVRIPVVMISKKDGQKIKSLLEDEMSQDHFDSDLMVTASIKFYKPFSKQKSEVQYWMLPAELDSYKFLQNHTSFLQYLVQQEKLVFEPHFVLFRCNEDCQANYQRNGQSTQSFCIQGGKYCHPDPDGNGPLSGVDSLQLAITEMCVQSLFPQYFFDYFTEYNNCYGGNSKKLLSCQETAFKRVEELKPDAKKDSFTYEIKECRVAEIEKGKLLEQEYKLFTEQGLKFYPALFVNGSPYRGDLTLKESAQEFICEGFENLKNIDACEQFETPEEDGTSSSNDSNFNYVIITVCIVLFFVFLIGLFIYRRKIKLEVQKELTIQVDAAIQQYYALNEGK